LATLALLGAVFSAVLLIAAEFCGIAALGIPALAARGRIGVFGLSLIGGGAAGLATGFAYGADEVAGLGSSRGGGALGGAAGAGLIAGFAAGGGEVLRVTVLDRLFS